LKGFLTWLTLKESKVGKRQTIDTLISEEALVLAKYLGHERKEWNPRIPIVEKQVRGT
jgi:hypothetical protein